MSLTPKFPHFLHGGDYNPDQWLDRPDILEKDIQLMQEAHVNCVSVGIFAWATLEPEEGVYNFEWLDQVIDRLWKGGIHVFLATPSGARPSWMAQKYPEVLRVNNQHQRMHFGERHNHCYTSPYYREKVRQMDTLLAERYSSHPAVLLWHLSNEYGGECHCPLCQEAFRGWLKEKYGTLENLNRCWWTNFWSQRYTDWSQVESPSPLGEVSSISLWIDWRRFCTAQCKSFMMMERDAVQAVNPELKCTANLMERFWDYDYFSLAEGMDVVSWDAYPEWHRGDDVQLAAEFAMQHDLFRSLKKQPFLLMESTPSQVNWKPHNKLKRPGMHLLSSLQAVAHGSQSVMYFQWRKGRGASEMFHGAVVDHYGESDTRVFRDVAQVGQSLERLEPIYNERNKADVLLIFDWENRWALSYTQAGHKGNFHYFDTVNAHYRALWEKGVSVDLADMREVTDLSGYKLVIAPLMYMLRNGFEEKIRRFVENGGTFVTTYFSGVVDEYNLAYMGARPHGLTDVLGLRAEELDAIWPHETNSMVMQDGASYTIRELCEVPANVTTAKTIGVYGSDFYKDMPCLTKNDFGAGHAWWIGGQLDQDGLHAIYDDMIDELGLATALPDDMPQGVIATRRGACVFLQNFSGEAKTVTLADEYTDLLTGETVSGSFEMPVFGVMALVRALS